MTDEEKVKKAKVIVCTDCCWNGCSNNACPTLRETIEAIELGLAEGRKESKAREREVYEHYSKETDDIYEDYTKRLKKLEKEIEQWKQEWQDAQIKANEEGFARTTLQIKYSELEKENTRLSKMLNEAIGIIEQEDIQCKMCSFYLSCRDGDCAYKNEIPTFDVIRAELEKRVEKEE